MTDEPELLGVGTAPAMRAVLPASEWLAQRGAQRTGLGVFLRIGVGIARALADLHARSSLHRDLRPENILVDPATGAVQLRAADDLRNASGQPAALEPNPASLPYMAPEQTGRMNRAVDARSDLYACGISLYQLLTGELPFAASSPVEWVHCHIAKPPVPVADRVSDVPRTLAQLIEKLLAKEPEARYQTAAGLEADLRHCLAAWERDAEIGAFTLGAEDAPNRLRTGEHLYGRAAESDRLLSAFERVAKQGNTEFLLVSGSSGMGKSAVVKELDRALGLRPGMFVSGKFDQYAGHAPYAPLSQAFAMLVRNLLTKPETELALWRDALKQALGDHARLICELAPDLELIIGSQPAVPALPPQNARPRLYMALRRFLGVFARPDHPLSLFLDDLQWLDGGTLDFVEHLVTDPDVRHTLVIGAYRSNEVAADHPLLATLERIRGQAGRVGELALQPLTVPEVSAMLADGLRVGALEVAPLAAVIVEKTAGNPFFAIQFTRELLDSGVLAYDATQRGIRWELTHVRERPATDNIVDLVLLRVERLSPSARRLLAVLACYGRAADTAALGAMADADPAEVATALAHAVRLGLVSQNGIHYGFVHDRVEEAAYQLMPEPLRADLHRKIGRMLLTNGAAAEQTDSIFEVVNHLQRGSTRMREEQERVELARLHLIAGKRAKAASDFATALDHLTAGEGLLQQVPGDAFHDRPELAIPLARHRAECEWLVGELETAEARLAALDCHVSDKSELASITALRLEISMNLGRFDLGVQLGLSYLERAGHAMPVEPSQELLAHEYSQILELWNSRGLDTQANLPALQLDAPHAAMLEVIRALQACALFGHYPWLHSLLACRTVLLSLVDGHVPASVIGYIILAMTVGPRFGDYGACLRFGRFALALVEHHRLDRMRPITLLGLGAVIMPWGQPLRSAMPYLRESLESALRIGDINVAASGYQLIANYLAAGHSLDETERETLDQLALSQRLKFSPGVVLLSDQLRFVRCLRHEGSRFPELSDETWHEATFECALATEPAAPLTTCWYWIRKLAVRVIAQDPWPALEAARHARALLWVSPSGVDSAEHTFYAALAHAGVCSDANTEERAEHLRAIAEYQQQLQLWAAHCPDNFEHRALLVSAELARLQGEELAAQKLYEQAIRSAEEHAFVQVEALANELAARFYATQGNRTVARAYLRQALTGYQRWGATAKVTQLQREHPFLSQTPSDAGIRRGLLQIDLATVIRASSAIAQELIPEHVTTNVMKVAIEHTGARRGVLLLTHGAQSDQLTVVAHASTGAEGVTVALDRSAPSNRDLPGSILRYVARTKQSVRLDDASLPNPFSSDEYLHNERCRSLWCLPLVKLTQLVGILYLENELSSYVFAPKQVALLELLASQAALSLDHARLYADLRKSREYMNEAEHLSRTGTFSWKPGTDELFWSDEVFRILGITGAPTTVAVRDRIHPEDHARFDAVISGSLRPDSHGVEYRLLMPDGAIKHISVAAHPTRAPGPTAEYVGAVRDVTELRQSESTLQRTREALADVTRVASLGEMSAAIAHEVNQPLAAIGINASTCLRWLRDEQLNVAEARDAATRIVRDATRAAEVIRGLRNLFSRSAEAKSLVDLNEAMREVIALTRHQVHGHGAIIRSDLVTDLPLVMCDRVQLQQVVVNLLLNAAEATREIHHRAREVQLKTLRRSTDHVHIAVSDTGPGIAAERWNEIFRPFQSTKQGGMGMGLSICKTIVESHGGTLGVNSVLGAGSTFEISLPLQPAP